MKNVFSSMTIRAVIGMMFPPVLVAIQNPTPETIGAAVVSVVGFLFAVKGRYRIGDLEIK